jgi:hypothetical protein
MKNSAPCIASVLAALLISCEALPVNYSLSQSWHMNENARNKKIKGTFRLYGVTVDRSGGWDSLQREAEVLAPLYFWKQGYSLRPDNADYAVDIRVREREYILKWQTRRSLSVDVRVWELGENQADLSGLEQRLPLAAGRVIAAGDRSFSSSQILGRMLSKAVKKAAKHLDKGKLKR